MLTSIMFIPSYMLTSYMDDFICTDRMLNISMYMLKHAYSFVFHLCKKNIAMGENISLTNERGYGLCNGNILEVSLELLIFLIYNIVRWMVVVGSHN